MVNKLGSGNTRSSYGWILLGTFSGLVLIGLGNWFAVLSHPDRHPTHAGSDRVIIFYVLSGLGCTILGLGLFLATARHTTKSMTPQTRRDVNSGVAAGLVLQLVGAYCHASIEAGVVLGTFLFVSSIPVFIWSCRNYAVGSALTVLAPRKFSNSDVIQPNELCKR
jgi:hypothetical protein